jgi:uncharacterized membrane protein (DUF485 family)
MPDTPVSEPSATEPTAGGHVHRRSEHPVYEELHASKEFAELRRNYRSFALPWTIGFLAWYLLYVVMSSWAHDFMSHKLIGHINVALVFGLLQFLSTFVIARIYSQHAQRNLDPLAEKLQQRYEEAIR